KGSGLAVATHPDHLVAPRADADEADRDAEVLRDRSEVVARLGRQVLLAAAVADLALEAGQLLVFRLGHVDDRLVVRDFGEARTFRMPIADADAQRVQP